MLDFREFTLSKMCKQLVLPEEDCPQDAMEWKRLVFEDQRRQYDAYLGVRDVVESTDEERRVEERLAQLTKKNLPVPVEANPESSTRSTDRDRSSQREARETTCKNEGLSTSTTRGGQKFDKVAYQRDYMRKRRAKEKENK